MSAGPAAGGRAAEGLVGLSGEVARRLAEINVEDLGPGGWTAVQTHLVDCLALVIAGRESERVRRARGMAESTDPVFALSLACGALGLDDFDESTRAHPGAVLVPALLAAAASQPEPVSGADLAASLVVGYEVFAWLGAAMDARQMHPRGRHPSAVLGPPAAAAAVARLLRLDARGIQNALGIGASFSCGIVEFDEHEDMRAVQTAWAATGGMRAARLAGAGFAASARALEASGGLIRREGAQLPSTETIGGPAFAIESVSFKPYPHFSDLHPATAALRAAMHGANISADEVVEIAAYLRPAAVERLSDEFPPRTAQAAKRSAEFVLAICLLATDDDLVGTFVDDRLDDRQVLAVAERVRVSTEVPHQSTLDDDDATVMARVRVTLTDGRMLSGSSTGYPGDGRDPKLRWQLEDGLARLEAFTAGAQAPVLAAVEASRDLAVRLKQLTDIRDTARLFTRLGGGHDLATPREDVS
jgi:2-methylcitrate dehydratase PrpD